MEFSLRDLVYIGIYVATVAGIIVKFREQVKGVERSLNTANKIIFLERGGLNVVTRDDCERSQAALRRHSQDALDQISVLNQNIIRIMLDMNLEPIPMTPETLTVSNGVPCGTPK